MASSERNEKPKVDLSAIFDEANGVDDHVPVVEDKSKVPTGGKPAGDLSSIFNHIN